MLLHLMQPPGLATSRLQPILGLSGRNGAFIGGAPEWRRRRTQCAPSALLAAQGDYSIRPLELGDFRLGYPQVLAQLTQVGDLTEERFAEAACARGEGVRADPSHNAATRLR